MRRKLVRDWSPDDLGELKRLAVAGWSVGRIAARLRRSVRVVKVRAKLNGIVISGVRVRLRKSESVFEQAAQP